MQRTPKAFPLYKTIDAALTKVYETLAASRVKTPTYGVPTAASSSTDTLSPTDLLTQAVWVSNVIYSALTIAQKAFVTCKYDGRGPEREKALITLATVFRNTSANAGLVLALFGREFDFGESYCKSHPQIASECDVSLRTVERASAKVRGIVEDLRREVEDTLRDVFEPRGWIAPRLKRAA